MLFLDKKSMKFKISSIIFFSFLIFSSCEQQKDKLINKAITNRIMDSHTLSNYKEVTITNSHLNLKVDFENNSINIINNIAISMGNYFFTDNDGGKTKVEYSFVYKRNDNGDLKIILHHSSLPYVK